MGELAAKLQEVCRNPRVPSFNHYLFETIAALLRQSVGSPGTSAATFEGFIFPGIDLVL